MAAGVTLPEERNQMEAAILAPQIGFASGTIVVDTEGPRDFTDITDQVMAHVLRAGTSDGIVVVSSQHTTASIVVNEHEPELLKDLDSFLTKLAPDHFEYDHNSVPCQPGEQPNGHSHCQALLLNASVTLPIEHGRISLGRYQRIFLLELDFARRRTVRVTVLGAS
jgi:secondary thiamine-phosphate synthase enzyme